MIDAAQRGARRLAHWPILRLVPYARNARNARNARTHSDSQVAEIAASIGRFGFNNPVLVDEAGSIIAGHGRVLAAKRLGMDEAPVVILAHLTDAERRAYILADNKLAEKAGWDEDLLRLELAALQELDIDLKVVGFEDKEIDRLLADGDGEADVDNAPPPMRRLPCLATCGVSASTGWYAVTPPAARRWRPVAARLAAFLGRFLPNFPETAAPPPASFSRISRMTLHADDADGIRRAPRHDQAVRQ